MLTDVTEKQATSIFRFKEEAEQETSREQLASRANRLPRARIYTGNRNKTRHFPFYIFYVSVI
jgi:hypothetical protein